MMADVRRNVRQSEIRSRRAAGLGRPECLRYMGRSCSNCCPTIAWGIIPWRRAPVEIGRDGIGVR